MPRMIRQIINKTRMCIFCPLPPILFLMDGSTFICFCISYIYQKQMHLTRFCSHLEVCTLKIKAVSNVDNNNGIYIIYIVHVLTYNSTIYQSTVRKTTMMWNFISNFLHHERLFGSLFLQLQIKHVQCESTPLRLVHEVQPGNQIPQLFYYIHLSIDNGLLIKQFQLQQIMEKIYRYTS